MHSDTHSLTRSSKTTPYRCFSLFHAHARTPTTNMTTLYLKAILRPHGESMSLQYMTSRGQAQPRPGQDWALSLLRRSQSSSVPPSVSFFLLNLSFCVTGLHSSLHSADTFTTFWWVGPAGRWASPSGVVTGGVGMLMIAVVIWLLWQFRGAGSSTRMFRLERLEENLRKTSKD